jgi:hypothetical protein
MHIFSILTLISVAAFATATSPPDVLAEKTDPELGGSCYSISTFEDKLGNKCTWYAEEKDLRCPWSKYLSVGGVGAEKKCCACGGGINQDYSGTYFIQNVDNGRYLYHNGYKLSSAANLNNYNRYGGRVQIKPTGLHQWALQFTFAKRYVSFKQNGSVGTVKQISERETFDIDGIVSINNSGGVAFQNSATDTYLSISASSGIVGTVSDWSGTTDNTAVFKLISSSTALEEQDKKD